SAPMAPNVCAYWVCGNGAEFWPGLRMRTSPGPACDPSLPVIVVWVVLVTAAASVPAASVSTQKPHFPLAQIAACGLDADPHAAVVDRSSWIRRYGNPGLRLSG